MPTSATNTFTGSGVTPEYPKPEPTVLHFAIGNSVQIAKGTVVGELSASLGKVKAYASGNSDGSQIPIGIMQFDVNSDGSGNITVGSATSSQGPQPFTPTRKTCPVLVRGTFSCADLTGLDATALTNQPGWHLLNGTVSAGVLELS